MIEAFTCPHCDTALELPAAAPTQAVLCPCCRGVLPNPHPPRERRRETDQPLVARAIDQGTPQWPDKTQFGCVALLGMIGVLAVSILLSAGMESVALGRQFSSQSRMGIALLATLAVYCFGCFLVFLRLRPYSSVGVFILVAFGAVGGILLPAVAALVLGQMTTFLFRVFA